MGGCLSSSGGSSSSSRSNGEVMSLSCLGLELWRRTRSRKTFSDRVIALHQSSSIPNRIFKNGKSRSSCIFTQQGCKGINQDSMIVWEDFMSEGTTFCGVFDGHGPFGHLVSRKVRDTLPLKLLSFSELCERKTKGTACCTGNFKSPDGEDCDRENVMEGNLVSQWKETFLQSYKAMDKELKSHPNLDCFCSGSTAVSILKKGSDLYVGNIGDSRAVLGSKDNNGTMVAIQLTVDLKPDLPKEAERIKGCKGRVFAMQDEPEVSRVWLPFDDAPGLAMARAFGDFCLKEYGVISVPEFTHRALTQQDLFIVLASDGIWDVLSNEDVVEIVSSAPNRSSAARLLVDAAVSEWETKYPTSKVDDCAAVCLYLDGKMDYEESNHDEPYSSSPTVESDDRQNSEPSLQRNCTVRSSSVEIGVQQVEAGANKEIVARDDPNWSGLEGVTRVNSLVQLPRFREERPNA